MKNQILKYMKIKRTEFFFGKDNYIGDKRHLEKEPKANHH